jgi:predicted dehydrogenase
LLKAGIIGFGVGEQHIAGYEAHPGCRVVAVADFAADKLDEAKRKYPHIRCTSSADDVLEDRDIDVVSIASYDNYHYEQIVKAIATDKHLFVEKPLCLHEEQAAHVRRLLSEKPYLKLSSNLILRRYPRFKSIKRLTETGEMGELFCVEGAYNYGRLHKLVDGWRGSIDFYSVMHGGGIHMIDLLLWITGDRVVEVSAFGNNICTRGSRFRYNDLVTAVLKFESGIVGRVSANFGCVMPHLHQLALYGTKATVINELDGALLYTSREPTIKARPIKSEYPDARKGDMIESFIDAILNDSKPEVGADEVFGAMSVSFAIERAVRENSVVRVNHL